MSLNKKEVIIIAGANGAGKSTFAHKLLKALKYEFINADEIAKRINPKDLTKVRLKAGKEFLLKIKSLIKSKKDFILETTMSGKYIEKIIKVLKREDYIISIFFLFLDSKETCLNRIKERVIKGGHNIPREDVIRRYYRGKVNFWGKYRYMVNRWYLMSNSQREFIEVSIGSNGDTIVNDSILFNKFLKDFNE